GHGHPVQLPTYAFQRRRYWLADHSAETGDVACVGLVGAEHALLGAVVQQPDTGGVVLTGRLSLSAQPWLADHALAGVVLFPGAGFVELAIRAGDEVGCAVLQELTLTAPLAIPAAGGVQVQVVVSGADESDDRAVSVYAREDHGDAKWALHAEGLLGQGVEGLSTPITDLAQWPPVDAGAVDVSDAYARLAERGYVYGEAFQGLRAMWRRGQEVFADIVIPDDSSLAVDGFGIHPMLLDAALHAMLLTEVAQTKEISVTGHTSSMVVPFSWAGISLQGVGAARVRARLAPAGQDAVSIELADTTGAPVLSIASLKLRPITTDQLHNALTTAID
ncbi:polyketide synthase dehydratase domain-containing protein, partial [Mycobacterium sp. 852002-40037_SCH5390672]|uniref:polyketide synthase dehydratase domain-containing protein n=1 Tax=Mycobacterium sp. 852002-40037_SCH5390672 TaxID=1834089 RepID=UPI000AF95753